MRLRGFCRSAWRSWTIASQTAAWRSARCTRSPAGGNGAIDGTASALFAAGVAARTRGQVLWCVTRKDLFAPSLAQVGLSADRVIYVEAGDEKTVLACFEEGLRHGGLGAVVGEVARLSMTASRRLQLCAEGSGTMGIAVRRWRREAEAADFGQPTAANTRWRVTALPSSPCRPPASAGPDGSLNSSAARRANALILNWKPAMRRVVSLYLPTWPTDRLRRRLGKDAPPAEVPVVMIGRSGRKRLVLAADAAAQALRLLSGHGGDPGPRPLRRAGRPRRRP